MMPKILADSSNENGWSSGVKKLGPSFVFDVILPSADVYSDLSLVIPWYWNGHYKYASSMTFPLLLQFLSTTYKWFRLEKRESKRWSWIILLLQCWPQWRAIRIIQLEMQKDEEAQAKKIELMREVTTTEPFLEAWPSILVMTIICFISIIDDSFWDYCGEHNLILWHEDIYNNRTWTCNGSDEYLFGGIDPPPQYCEIQPLDNKCAVFSGPGGPTWFFITMAISAISGSLGVTKFLQNGPFPLLTTEGLLGGICKCKFILAFLSVLTSVITKGFIGTLLIISHLLGSSEDDSSEAMKRAIGASEKGDSLITLLLTLFGTLMFPYLILSVISISCSTGLSKTLLKVLLNYPAALMLSCITYFTIGPPESNCYSTIKANRHLGLSKFYSCINILLTVTMNVAVILYYASYDSRRLNILIPWGPLLVVGLLIYLIFLTVDEKCCTSKCCYQSSVVPVHMINVRNDGLEIVKIDND